MKKYFNRQDFLNIANDLTMLLSKIEKGVFLYQENNLILELENLLEKFNVKLNINSNQNHEIRSFSTQRLLFQSGIPNMILNIIGNLMQFSDHLVTFPSEKLLEKFKNLIEYYLKDNLEMQSSFFSIRNFRLLEQIFYKFPTLISDLLFDIFSKNAQILITKEYALDILMEMFKKHYTNLNNTVFLVKDYSDLSKIVDTEALFINLKCFKIFNWIPEYDIRILEDAMKFQVWPEEETGFLFHIDELESLLKSYQGDKTLLADARLDFLMNYLSFINVVTSYRYTDEVYKKLDSFLPIGKLKNLISLCGKRLEFRSVLLEIYGNIHIDFKNHLLNKRSSYYFTKPADMQYEEDPFFDKEYDNTVDLFISELKFLIEEEKGLKKIDEREFFNYLNSSLLGNLVKLMNYFLVIKEGDLHKLNKYIAKLEELNDYIYINRFIILAMYSVFQKEFDSPDRKLLEIELSKIDPNLKIKKDKTQIIGNCKAIIDLCKGIMCNRPVLDNKKGLISAKSTVNRINDTYLKTLNFSNKLQTRRNNLKLPFTKLLNKKDKTTGKIQITKCLTAYYEHYKMTMMSVDAKENVYIATLSENSVEMQNYAKNLCAFIYNQLVSEWNYKEKNKKYTMIESLCNNLFISTKSIQANLFEFMTEQGENNLLAMNKIWTEMKEIMSFVKYKTNIDRFWKEAFRRTMLLIKFHQFLCEDSNQVFFSNLNLLCFFKNF